MRPLKNQHGTPEKRYLQDLARWKLPFHVCVCVFRASYLPEWVFWNVHVKTPSLDALDVKTIWFLQACLQNQSSEYEISGVYPSRSSLLWVSNLGRFGEPQDPRRSDLSVTGPLHGNGSPIVNPSFLVLNRPSLITFNSYPFLVIIGDYCWVNYIGFVALKENRNIIGQLLCWSSVFFAASAASASVSWLWCRKAAPVSSWHMKSSLQHSSTEYAEYTVATLKQRWSLMPIYLAHDWRKKTKYVKFLLQLSPALAHTASCLSFPLASRWSYANWNALSCPAAWVFHMTAGCCRESDPTLR